MATKKPRKRAYIPPSQEVVNRKERVETTRPVRKQNTRTNNARGEYIHPKPTLKRTARRLPVYFLLIFALQYFLLGRNGNSDVSSQQLLIFSLGQAAIVTIVFAPLMHMMDHFAYNRWLKRTGRASS